MNERLTRQQRATIARAQRNQGYRDGLAGRPAARLDSDYQEGWRNGQRRRADLRRPLAEEE